MSVIDAQGKKNTTHFRPCKKLGLLAENILLHFNICAKTNILNCIIYILKRTPFHFMCCTDNLHVVLFIRNFILFCFLQICQMRVFKRLWKKRINWLNLHNIGKICKYKILHNSCPYFSIKLNIITHNYVVYVNFMFYELLVIHFSIQ